MSSGSARIGSYTDLLRLAAHGQQALDGRRIEVKVWEVGGHYRAALDQPPPGRSRLGPVPAGEGCRVDFGMASYGSSARGKRSVTFRLSVFREGQREIPFFEESIGPPGDGATGGWWDRQVSIPHTREGPFSLVLETQPVRNGPDRAGSAAGGSKGGEQAAWSAPHVICQAGRAAPHRLRHPHVILISVDTLRPDHLGAYGYPRPTSPALDALAAQSLVFANAFAPAPWTLPSHASMFTGRYPEEHGAGHTAMLEPLGPVLPTLAEILSDAGYATIAFTAGGMMTERNGLARGFESWTQYTRANLESVLPGVFDALGTSAPRPVFLFLHTYDVHGPYAYLPGSGYFRPTEGHDKMARSEWDRLQRIGYHHYLKLNRFDGLAGVIAAYDSGIRFVDGQLKRLFTRLRDLGMYDDALIVVTSDHGESLHERGVYIGHSYSLYDEEVRVPLIVRLPGATRTGATKEMVDLVDLVPLVLDVAGVSTEARFSGGSPLRRLDGLEPPRRYVRGEASFTGARYARSRGWKLISASYPRGDRRSEVPEGLEDRFPYGELAFRLSRDPRERRNLAQGATLSPAVAREVALLREAALDPKRPASR